MKPMILGCKCHFFLPESYWKKNAIDKLTFRFQTVPRYVMIIPISSVQMRGCAHFEGASQSRVFVSEDLNATQCVFLSFLANQEEEPTTRFLQTNF